MIVKTHSNSCMEDIAAKNCREKLLEKFNLEGDTTRSLYGHYGNRFIQEISSEFNGDYWEATFEVGKPRKE